LLYYAPGIYVEEVPSGTNPIQPVGTSTAAFIGNLSAPAVNIRVNEAIPVDNWRAFERIFCPEGSTSTNLTHAVHGFFLNGGRRCYVVNLGAGQEISGGGRARVGVDVLETIDEVKIVAAPGINSAAATDALITHCENMKNRVAIIDGPPTVPNVDALTRVATAPSTTKPAEGSEGGQAGGMRPKMSKQATFYFPHITIREALPPYALVDVPPSGHIAGIWARSDATRGVHKAPANEVVQGALNVSYPVSRAEQEVLNPRGVNCIRYFSREGVMVWGARTLDDGQWRYLNVRRFFNMVEESIALSTRWVVFEPNDRPLWKAIVRDVRAFLTMLWRDGALMGKTPDEAFFVQCDDETNTPETIDLGLVITRIGLAPVKPAEFVIFRIGQSASGTKIESEGAGA
jgi:phage tail sheath protein FI